MVLAGLGGRAGRRAALRGLLAMAAASALVNGPLKLTWRRPRPVDRLTRISRPHSFSFPSGHAAAALAFATGAGWEIPWLLAPLGALATAVGFSRVHGRVHYPSDVLVGAGVGAAAGLASGPVLAALSSATGRQGGLCRRALPGGGRGGVPPGDKAAKAAEPAAGARSVVGSDQVVLVVSPYASRVQRGLPKARKLLKELGLKVVAELEVQEADRLPALLRGHVGAGGPLVVAAGGDGTVGTVAHHLVDTGLVLGVLPLGTSNDFARSVQIPRHIDRAVRLFCDGKVSRIDLGRLDTPGQQPMHFVHAATAGLNVSFAKLATRASLRKRLGRLTYVVAATRTIHEPRPFDCEIVHGSGTERLNLIHLSVINAPVFGGFLGMRVRDADPDDHLLDVLAVEHLPVTQLLRAGLYQLFGSKRSLKGVDWRHISRMTLNTDMPLEVALDGEVCATLPGEVSVVPDGLRIVTPVDFEDVGSVGTGA